MTDRALLVGINAYPGAPLAGCLNDIQDMAATLVSDYGFKSSSIRMLVDKRATTAAILTRLKWLVAGAKAGDRLVFHYSGHGAQVADRNNNDEIDGMDEVICPVNFDWDEKHLIRDDKFAELFGTVPAGVHFVWISDSCHSGSMTRELGPPPKKRKSVKGAKKPKILGSRFMPAPLDHAWRHRVATDLGHKAKGIASSAPKMNVAFISGCKDNQTSADAEFAGRPNGALTFYLLQSLKRLKGQSVTAVVEATRAALKKAGYDQIPQIDGTLIDKPFLG